MKGLNTYRRTTLQSKPLEESAYEVHFSDQSKIKGCVIVGLTVNFKEETDTYGINSKQIVSDDVFNSSYLTMQVYENTQTPFENIPLREILEAQRNSNLGFYPIHWNGADFDSTRIISQNKTAHDGDAGKVYEIGVVFVRQNDSLGIK